SVCSATVSPRPLRRRAWIGPGAPATGAAALTARVAARALAPAVGGGGFGGVLAPGVPGGVAASGAVGGCPAGAGTDSASVARVGRGASRPTAAPRAGESG